MKNIEEELKTIKIAYSRLLNQHKELEKLVSTISGKLNQLTEYTYEQLIELNNTQQPTIKLPLVYGSRYIEQISEVISAQEKEWNGSQFINYELILKDRQEIYTAFISIKYKLEPKIKIKFLYSGEGRLSSLKIN